MTDVRIRYALDQDGGFTAGIPGTNLTAYAYPSSDIATRARHQPQAAALAMLGPQFLAFLPAYVDVCGYAALKEHARRDWARIDAVSARTGARA